MRNLTIETMIEQLKAIRQELAKKSSVQTHDRSDGAVWLRVRMLKRAVDDLDKAINELDCYQRPDKELDAFGQNLKTLEENSF